MEADSVERILRDRGILIEKHILVNALASAVEEEDGAKSTSFASWATQYLGDDTLLTPDELDTFSSLVELGIAEKLESCADFESATPRDQGELQAAIRELNQSTSSIGKQTETLKQQQEALAKFAKARINGEATRADFEAVLLQTRAAEARGVKSSVDDLSRSLEMKVSDLREQTESCVQRLGQTVSQVLAADDKLLTSLEKLGAEMSISRHQDDNMVDQLREVCMKLIKCTVEMVRCRLDRLYLEALGANSHASASSPSPGTKKSAAAQELQDEVDSLYSELLPVAQMSVENQFLEPGLHRLTSRNGESLGRATTTVDYVCECLEYIQERVDVLVSRMQAVQSHRVAAEIMAGASRDELDRNIVPRQKKRDDNVNRSPTRRRKSSGHTSPARIRSNLASSGLQRRRSSGTALDEAPLDLLLRVLAVPLPADTDGLAGSGRGREGASLLSGLLKTRSVKADDVAASTQQAFEQSAAVHLGDAAKALHLLRDSLLADSPYGRVRLIDPDISEPIAFVEDEVRKLYHEISTIDPAKANADGPKRREVIQRWRHC